MDKYNHLITKIIMNNDTLDDTNTNSFTLKLIKLLKNRINNNYFTSNLIKLLEKRINKKYVFMDIYSDIISRINNPTIFNKIYLIFNNEKLKENINEFDSYGWRILTFTIYHFFPLSFNVNKDIIYFRLINLIYFLLINGANPNLTNYCDKGLNAIQFALRYIPEIRVMKIILNMLIEYGARIKRSDIKHIAENKNYYVVKFVFETYFT